MPGGIIKAPVYEGVIEFENIKRMVKIMGFEIPVIEYVDGLLGRQFLDLFEVCFNGGRRVSFELLVQPQTSAKRSTTLSRNVGR